MRRGPYKIKDPVERFWSGVDKSGECWNWTRSLNNKGYGYFSIRKKLILAHRYSWQISNGEIPDDKEICHKCDNPRCVNPSHLFLGSHGDNMMDAWNKGRLEHVRHISMHGESNNFSKLTDEDVIRMRKEYKEGAKQRDLAVKYGVTQPGIRYALSMGWSHVGEHVFLEDSEKSDRISKLSREQIAEIRERCKKRGDQTRLAMEFGVCQQLISKIILNPNWR